MTTSQSLPKTPNPLLVILSGPSGVGKDAILSRMRKLKKPYHFTVTVTTRLRRPTEQNGLDYIFVTGTIFRRMVDNHELLEWAQVYGNMYGVPKNQVVEAFNRGLDVIIKADVQGAATIRRLVPEALSIFLSPPSMDELELRLKQRMTESSDTLKVRLQTAEVEIDEAPKFDYVVVNRQDQLDNTVQELERIIAKERLRAPPRCVSL